MEQTNEDALFTRIWERIKEHLPGQTETRESAFLIRKDLSGQWRWFATFTNNFRDRDGEIISEKALDSYLDRLEAGLTPMPELWVGHVKGTRHGAADMVFGAGNFLVATGTFDDTPQAQRAIRYYQKNAREIDISHGFTFLPRTFKDGVYEDINTFEISTLPPPLVASNPYTEFEVQSMQQITDTQRAALYRVLDKEFVDGLIATREDKSAEIIATDEAFKDFAEASATEPTDGETPAAETEGKPFAEMVAALYQDMNELMTMIGDQGKAFVAYRAQVDAAIKATTDENAALKSTVAKLQTEQRLAPRASTAKETQLSDEEAAKAKDALPKETDPFWSA